MFDALMKSKFYCKCKADMKMVKNRIEMIKKKRNAMQKYLRNDVIDLLRNALDVNAYGRADGLSAELNRTECYELIEQCVTNVLSHLKVMDKQGDCPEECREAVSSLMFAAARFADLPELRELRTMFSDKYGSSIDFYVNKQFAEKLKSGPPSKDKKLQLLQDIAHESGIEWSPKALEKKLYNETTFKEDSGKVTNGSVTEKDSNRTKYQFKNARDLTAPEKKHTYYENKGTPSIEERFSKGSPTILPVKEIQVIKKTEPKQTYYENKGTPGNEERFSKGSPTILPVKEIQVIKKTEPKQTYYENKGTPGNEERFSKGSPTIPPVKEIQVIKKTEPKHTYYETKGTPSIEERFSKGSHTIPPVKEIQVIKKTEPKVPRGDPKKEAQEDQPQKYNSIPPPYTVSEVTKPKTIFRDKMAGPANSKDAEVTSKPILKSVRTRNARPPVANDTGNRGEHEKIADKNKEKAAQGQRILKFFDGGYDQKDEEEIMMDKLLKRLSHKKDLNKNIKPSPLLNTPAADHDLSKVIRNRSKDVPNRSSSLPGELNNPTETPKSHTRTASFQPDMMNGNNLHVHPKMPDYDDFLARLESLRQKS